MRTPTTEDSTTASNSASTSLSAEGRDCASGLTKLLVSSPVLNCSPQRRTASTISGRSSPAEHGEQRPGVHAAAGGLGLSGEGVAELVEGELVALEPCPGVVEVVGGVDGTDEPGGQAVVLLVALEGVEGAGGEDPAEVE